MLNKIIQWSLDPLLAESSSEAYASCRHFFKDQNWIKSSLEAVNMTASSFIPASIPDVPIVLPTLSHFRKL